MSVAMGNAGGSQRGRIPASRVYHPFQMLPGFLHLCDQDISENAGTTLTGGAYRSIQNKKAMC